MQNYKSDFHEIAYLQVCRHLLLNTLVIPQGKIISSSFYPSLGLELVNTDIYPQIYDVSFADLYVI